MRLPKELTTVTPFSKGMALSLFIILPLIAFIGGIHYGEQKASLVAAPPSGVCTPMITPTKEALPSVSPRPTISGARVSPTPLITLKPTIAL